MSKCQRVKNPCKICLQSVTQKNGVQCLGACQTWIHFACLNYTPGKIKDIKAGIIKITCPCPDCKSTFPKEIRVDEPYSCTNSQCPANTPPHCMNDTCPSSIDSKMNQTSNVMCQPAQRCGVERCQDNIKMKALTTCESPSVSSAGISSSCTPGCVSDQAGDTRIGGRAGMVMPGLSDMEKMCSTVGQLTSQINELMKKMKQAVRETGPTTGSGGQCPGVGRNPLPAGCDPPPNQVCDEKRSRVYCPKPCYCPGNPAPMKKSKHPK